jgi:hypothetical protein
MAATTKTTGKATPRSVQALAAFEVERRSDYARWCEGWQRVCDGLAQVAIDLEDELYVRLAARGDYNARSKARKALRPLRFMAAGARAVGRLGPRAFRRYQTVFQDEIDPAKKTRNRFDHRA